MGSSLAFRWSEREESRNVYRVRAGIRYDHPAGRVDVRRGGADGAEFGFGGLVIVDDDQSLRAQQHDREDRGGVNHRVARQNSEHRISPAEETTPEQKSALPYQDEA